MIPNLKFAGLWDEMDVLARAQFFEGYLHVPPFKKIRGTTGKPGLLKVIREALAEIGGTPNPEWGSSGDTRLYRSAWVVTNRVIESQKAERTTEAVDVLQAMMGLSGWTDDAGDLIELGDKPPFWKAGKHIAEHLSEKFTSGKLAPADVSGLIVKPVRDRAMDAVLQEKARAKKRQENQELIEDESLGTTGEEEEDWGQVIDAIFANPENPISKRFFSWLVRQLPSVMRKGEGSRLITNYLDLLKAGLVKSDTEAAEALGTSPSGLSNTKKVFTESMAGYIKHNPNVEEELEDMFSDAHFLRNLLRGRVRGDKVATLAQKIAARHLARLEKSAKSFKFKRDVKLKSGTVIPKGAEAQVKYNQSVVADVTVEGVEKPVKISVAALTRLLDGYPKMPTVARLEKMSNDGIAATPMGERVEPDGYGPSGAPSWLLVAGVI
jgi:hypothetical protein